MRLFGDIDKDGSGEVGEHGRPGCVLLLAHNRNLSKQVEASEFFKYFGRFISGEAGSLSHKPTWFLKEMDKISSQIDKIDDCGKVLVYSSRCVLFT